MRRETEAFLNLVRDAEDPTRADEARVQRALVAAIAAGAAPSVAVHGTLDGNWFGDALGKLGLSGAKLHLLAVGAALTLATGDTAMPAGGADPGGALLATATTGEAVPPDPAAAAPLDPDTVDPRTLPFDPASAPPGQAAPRRSANVLERAKPRARTTATKTAERAAPVAASGLRGELALLQRVQAALKRGDGASALHELEAHRTTDTTLLAERRAAYILALCKLNRIADARREAAVFADQHPHSLQRAAIEASCVNR
jgi:hypothetical protein